jgi:hypothetical protein
VDSETAQLIASARTEAAQLARHGRGLASQLIELLVERVVRDDVPEGETLARHQCKHLRAKSLPRHSVLRLETVAPEEHASDYHFAYAFELCLYCSGFTTAKILTMMGADPMGADVYELGGGEP